MKHLFKISSNYSDSVSPDVKWKEEVRGVVTCCDCNGIRPDWFPRPVDVVLDADPGNVIERKLAFASISIFHRDFIEQLYHHLPSTFILGKCFDANNRIIKEYCTAYCKNRIMIRGDQQSTYCVCPSCGAIWAHGWKGPQYTLEAYLTEADIYQDYYSSIFIEENLAFELDFSPWPDAELIPITIRKEPIDGQHLPCDSEEIVKKFPQKKWERGLSREEALKLQINSLRKLVGEHNNEKLRELVENLEKKL